MNTINNSILIPKQPFMVKLSPFYYKYVMGNYGISHFYEFHVEKNVMEIDTSVPDGCIDLIFHFDRNKNICGAEFYGTALEPHPMKIFPECNHFGVRFLPGIVPVFADASMPELVDKIIEYEDIGIIKGLSERIFYSNDFNERISIFLDVYINYYNKKYAGFVPLKDSLVNQIIRERGNISVLELSEKTCYSTSYIDKIFLKEIGISPKRFCAIIRFQWLMNKIIIDPNTKLWGNGFIMTDFGYYDQSHLIHDFKKYCGRTPNNYRKELFQADYQNRLKVIKDIEIISKKTLM